MEGGEFHLGVNYWPRKKAMWWWKRFDLQEVKEEFGIIATLGLKVVRIFLLWEDFQPSPEEISQTQLTNLTQVLDVAVENKLVIDLTFFTGHMSGPNWVPKWLLDDSVERIPNPIVRQVVSDGGNLLLDQNQGGYVDIYENQIAREAAFLLMKTVVSSLSNHPGVWCWNLGNEPDLLVNVKNEENVLSWIREMKQIVRDQDQLNRPLIFGLHLLSMVENNGFRVDHIGELTEFSVMHSYPMYTSWADGPLDAKLVPFTCVLSSLLSGKPTLMEEWGGCTLSHSHLPQEVNEKQAANGLGKIWNWIAYGEERNQFMASEDAFCLYVQDVIHNLIAVGATGSMLWCFADYDPSLWDLPPCKESVHERFFGLVRTDGSLKPHAVWLKEQHQSGRTFRVQSPCLNLQLGVTPEEFYRNPKQHTIRLYQEFCSIWKSKSQ